MSITVLMTVFVFLILFLAVLMVFLFKPLKNKKRNSVDTVKPKAIALHDLCERLKDKKLSTQNLKDTLNLVIEEYGVIENIDIYVDIILKMTRHPSVTKDIILSFEKDLSKLNPKHASLISKNVMKGLNLR